MDMTDDSTCNEEKPQKIPNHIALIMDGNGRWATKRGLPRVAGHRAGTENLRNIIKACVEFGVPCLTIYAFSTENWSRPADEVEGLMGILAEVIDKELDELNRQGVQLRHLGHLEQLPENLRKKVVKAIEMTKDNSRLILNLAWNYGGRDEILCAVKQMMAEGMTPDQVTFESFNNHLFTAGLPDPDLLIRTSGEMRISNFLIWQSAYAEWYVTSTYWPDFGKEELRKALLDFCRRDRRFGNITSSP